SKRDWSSDVCSSDLRSAKMNWQQLPLQIKLVYNLPFILLPMMILPPHGRKCSEYIRRYARPGEMTRDRLMGFSRLLRMEIHCWAIAAWWMAFGWHRLFG